MTAGEFALQVAAIGGQQVWHAAWLTLMWAVLAAALTVVLWGIVHPGRWLRRPAPITHLVLGALPGDGARASLALIAAMCPCCNGDNGSDCYCPDACGVPRCQAADPEEARSA